MGDNILLYWILYCNFRSPAIRNSKMQWSKVRCLNSCYDGNTNAHCRASLRVALYCVWCGAYCKRHLCNGDALIWPYILHFCLNWKRKYEIDFTYVVQTGQFLQKSCWSEVSKKDFFLNMQKNLCVEKSVLQIRGSLYKGFSHCFLKLSFSTLVIHLYRL